MSKNGGNLNKEYQFENFYASCIIIVIADLFKFCFFVKNITFQIILNSKSWDAL